MIDISEALERETDRFHQEPAAFERLIRRRDRKGRNRRVSAAVLAIVLTVLSIAGLMRAFRSVERPATEPTPTPVDTGIFSGLGGWIAYGNNYHLDVSVIWAMDPERPEIRKQLSTASGEPLAWSSDGSKLLIGKRGRHGGGSALYVLNADGSETLLVDAGAHHGLSGGSFSPDGSKVVYADDGSGIYVVDTDGGSPQRVLSASGQRGLMAPTFSPDGTQIAYIDGHGDWGDSLRVMNADGSGSRVLLKDDLWVMKGRFTGGLVWSPDGSRLAFGMGNRWDRIWVVGADGSGLTPIGLGTNPQWSPDGSRIAFDHMYGVSPFPMMIADADGTHIQRIYNVSSGPWNPLDRAESGT